MNPARIFLAAISMSLDASMAAAPLPKLKVSENQPLLVTADGQPFFYLGDTTWEPWFEAINQPGAGQMQYARALLESRPFMTRVPDQDVLAPHPIPTAVPGSGRYHFAATRDANGSYAMVYAPVARSFKVRMDKITGAKVKARWFDPRDGKATVIGTFESKGEREFAPPDLGEELDWVLVLDDAAKQFPRPGPSDQSPASSS